MAAIHANVSTSISISVTKCLEMGLVDEEGVSVNSTRGFLVSLMWCTFHVVWCSAYAGRLYT